MKDQSRLFKSGKGKELIPCITCNKEILSTDKHCKYCGEEQ